MGLNQKLGHDHLKWFLKQLPVQMIHWQIPLAVFVQTEFKKDDV